MLQCLHCYMTRSVRANGGWPGRIDRITAAGTLQVDEVAAAPVKEVTRVLKALAKRVDVRDRSCAVKCEGLPGSICCSKGERRSLHEEFGSYCLLDCMTCHSSV